MHTNNLVSIGKERTVSVMVFSLYLLVLGAKPILIILLLRVFTNNWKLLFSIAGIYNVLSFNFVVLFRVSRTKDVRIFWIPGILESLSLMKAV